jgi:hypothetical protein
LRRVHEPGLMRLMALLRTVTTFKQE